MHISKGKIFRINDSVTPLKLLGERPDVAAKDS